MKNLGWNFFWALLLADAVGLIMLKLSVRLDIVLTVAAVVFAILAVVMYFGGQARKRAEKREAEANAKLAELEGKVKETGAADTMTQGDEPAKQNP